MLTAVSLNPSIDRTLVLDGLIPGGLNRVLGQTDVAAGKGVNVALAAASLGEKAQCIGFMYREGASLFDKRLSENGIAWDYVTCPGAVRVNMKLFDQGRGEITELNAKGTAVNEAQLQALCDLVQVHARKSHFMLFSGSLPPGCPEDTYFRLMTIAAREGCGTMLDADGAVLRAGLSAGPLLVKPNQSELEHILGKKLSSVPELLSAAQALLREGARSVVVSMGADGALYVDQDSALRAYGLPIKVVSTVAAGDSMLAALAVSRLRGEGKESAFRMGVAAASVRCMTQPSRTISAADCARVMQEIQIERIL